ncbi:M14 family metallopeptidase [Salinicoccus sesuvii]|uniref:M14 family metallopeptidase n=1 Tax=Salinicoccus sesuvii TaxID=868281 RepID=A0ABV7N8A6_9STAP
MIPEVRNILSGESRNIVNSTIRSVNKQGQTIRDLIAKGQLTPQQFSELLTAIHALIPRGDVSVHDINVNRGKIHQAMIDQGLMDALLGKPGANILSEVAPGSVTEDKVADQGVTARKTDFIKVSSNLISFANFKEGFALDGANAESINASFGYTDFIPVEPNTTYHFKDVSRWLLYDGAKNFISTQSSTSTPFTTTNGARFARLNVRLTSRETAQLNKGTLKPYEPPYKYLDTNVEIRALSSGIVKERNIGDREITADKFEFLETTENLIDESDLLSGSAVLEGSQGVPSASTSNNVANKVRVQPLTKYTLSTANTHRVFLFDGEGKFIIERFYQTDVATVETTANTRYLSTNVHNSYLGKAQMNKGAAILPYTPYKRDKMRNIYSEGVQDILSRSDNLVDENQIQYGRTLSTQNGGQTEEHISVNVSGVIAVSGDTTYEADVAQSNRIAFYDKDMNFISYHTAISDKPITFRTPANARFMRLNIHRLYIGRAYVTKGKINKPYAPFGHHLKRRNFQKTVQDTDLYFDAPEQPSMTVDDSVHLKDLMPQDYYDRYDKLVAESYPTSKVWGNDPHGTPIMQYDFKPADVDFAKNEYPKILIHTGTHGSEKVPMYTVYKFFEMLCNNWQDNKILEHLRFNVHFVVIPVVCPWGVINHSRKNSNGVDLVRNYPISFDSGTTDPNASTYRGPYALSELEARYAYQSYKEHKDWTYVLDFHNFSTNEDINKNFWVAGTDRFTSQVGQMFIRTLTANLSKKHSFVDVNKPLGWVDLNTSGIYWLAKNEGFNATLYESCETIRLAGGKMYDSTAMTWALEGFVNWLYLIYRNSL